MTNETTYFSEIFNMTNEIVTHTDDIIALIMIGAVIAIVSALVGGLTYLFGNIFKKIGGK